MKKIILLFAVSLLLLPALSAQTTYFGVRGGVNLGWFSGNNWDDYISFVEDFYGIAIEEKAHTALHAGIYMESMVSDTIGIVGELNFSQYGQDYEYSFAGITYEGTYYINVVEIPLLLKIGSGSGGGFYGIVGPTVNLLFGDLEFEESGGGVSVSGSTTPDNTIVLGVTAGAGYAVEMSNGVLSFEARYGRNLTDAFDAENDPFDINGLKLLAGYGFRL